VGKEVSEDIKAPFGYCSSNYKFFLELTRFLSMVLGTRIWSVDSLIEEALCQNKKSQYLCRPSQPKRWLSDVMEAQAEGALFYAERKIYFSWWDFTIFHYLCAPLGG